METDLKTRREFLRSVSLFQALPDQSLDRLTVAVDHHKFSDGEIVFRQGDLGDRMYFVTTGGVDLLRDTFGDVHRLARVEPGGYFGELALLSGNTRVTTAMCVGDVELLSLSSRDLKRLLTESAPAFRSMMGVIKEYAQPDTPLSLWKRFRWSIRRMLGS